MGDRRIVGLHKHHWHRCNDENCVVCVGGLGYCNICGGAESTLTTDCGYTRLDDETQDRIYLGEIDYIRGRGWIVCDSPTPKRG